MNLSIAYLGPPGTNAETAAIALVRWLQSQAKSAQLYPYASIAQVAAAVAQAEKDLAVVPVENSIHGSVAITLDLLWELNQLKIQTSLVLPIVHALLAPQDQLESIKTVYSHPQAIAQCQRWLDHHLKTAQQIPTNSTAEAVRLAQADISAAAIASPRAAELYSVKILSPSINDYPNNYTKFWVLGKNSNLIDSDLPEITGKPNTHLAIAFSVPANVPGALVKPLQVFAERQINLSRIESRPTKRSLGEYIFFVELEGNDHDIQIKSALAELSHYTEVIKLFGAYQTIEIPTSV